MGKTTTAVNVAACIAEAGFATLVIDIDPQANATLGLGLPKDCEPNVYDVLAGRVAIQAAERDTAIELLKIVPAHPDLAGANVELPREPGSETRLRDALGGVSRALRLRPARLPAVARAADRQRARRRGSHRPGADGVFALEGLAGLLDTLALIQRELNPRLTIAGMLLTMHDGRTRLARDVEREVREHFPALVFDTVIPRNVRVGEAPSYGRPVTHHDPHCAGSDAYFELAKEVVRAGASS